MADTSNQESSSALTMRKIAHDIRGSLSVLKTYVDTLPYPKDDPDWVEFNASATRSLGKLERLADQIQTEAGR